MEGVLHPSLSLTAHLVTFTGPTLKSQALKDFPKERAEDECMSSYLPVNRIVRALPEIDHSQCIQVSFKLQWQNRDCGRSCDR